MILSLFGAGAVLCAGLRYGSAIFVAGAGNREVARCDGGALDVWTRKDSWQAQGIVRL